MGRSVVVPHSEARNGQLRLAGLIMAEPCFCGLSVGKGDDSTQAIRQAALCVRSPSIGRSKLGVDRYFDRDSTSLVGTAFDRYFATELANSFP